ncbi:MAG: hypothetical protein J6S53_01505 [Lentisphaeria bacterium]|nr:hypothetical protein [Lentisphaeria bacterium]
MKKCFGIFFMIFSVFSFTLPAAETISGTLQEKRTEFSRTGTNIDSFFDGLQARILYSFSQAYHHFSLIFETAKLEGKKKAEKEMKVLGDKAVNQIRLEAEKVIKEKVDNELKNLSSKVENTSSALRNNPSGKKPLPPPLPEKKEDFSIPVIPELDE